ncbi:MULTISPECIES: alpha/beta fold hydrolase [unclassified Streptomyces]|uniref:alpha/beta fold hydrolase n=1 Tax=unclassified Streptomyces TaxID=2593676 RepID=UPI00136F9D95|nr:alpha/beta fold hydrolase [Streptomyces sp. SID335]MYZ12164.1 alpha/beta fold hydrolase [Streptomyces sp. SID337]NDZ87170.1 thioesterase [Streptomyces sp. SID10115]NDZ99458.1 thioesterase [Streptomyces sp. SID10116]NEB50527.1 thioesterase [Streptomyces sp. SID339]
MGDWIRSFHPAPAAGTRLVCFPHAGGSASAYHALSAAVSGTVDPLVVQYPGRQERYGEPFAERSDDVVDAVLAALSGPPDIRPVALFGHSMGAVLAFETARRMTAEGRPPVVLFVSGRPAPSLPRRPAAAERPVHEMSDHELVDEMRKLSGTANELLSSPDLLPLILPPVRADYRLLDAHVHRAGPPLDCPVVALTGDADPRVTVEGARAWESETRGDFSCHILPGGHFFLDDHLPYVAEVIAASPAGRGATTA